LSKISDVSANPPKRSLPSCAVRYLPGIMLCIAVALASFAFELAEVHLFSHSYVEALVIAILLGMALRTLWQPASIWRSGIAFSAKQLLEVAVMLLGASISFAAVAASGMLLVGLIVAIVVVMIILTYNISRALSLPVRMSILIACGNSICGNSAIAAVAPVIGASNDDIASSISFTAVLGVLMVLGLPLLIPLLGLSNTQYGILAGLTVYAVPQVLAATVPAGLVSTQIGTLVKLIRVLLLGPVVIALSLISWRCRLRDGNRSASPPLDLRNLVPWFIPGFLVLASLRSFALVPEGWVGPIARTAAMLTVLSMAALGLGVDLRVIGNVGGRVTAAVTLSLAVLLGLSIGVVRFFP
jgi:uncharacterized integral membrane protein (TIGR00698 family)